MKKEFKENLIKLATELQLNERDAREMPLHKGLTLTFVENDKLFEKVTRVINGKKVNYGVFNTKEGYTVPFGQIVRNNNGLQLKPQKQDKMLEEFIDRINGEYSIVVADVIKLESSFGEGKQTYCVFEIPEKEA